MLTEKQTQQNHYPAPRAWILGDQRAAHQRFCSNIRLYMTSICATYSIGGSNHRQPLTEPSPESGTARDGTEGLLCCTTTYFQSSEEKESRRAWGGERRKPPLCLEGKKKKPLLIPSRQRRGFHPRHRLCPSAQPDVSGSLPEGQSRNHRAEEASPREVDPRFWIYRDARPAAPMGV